MCVFEPFFLFLKSTISSFISLTASRRLFCVRHAARLLIFLHSRALSVSGSALMGVETGQEGAEHTSLGGSGVCERVVHPVAWGVTQAQKIPNQFHGRVEINKQHSDLEVTVKVCEYWVEGQWTRHPPGSCYYWMQTTNSSSTTSSCISQLLQLRGCSAHTLSSFCQKKKTPQRSCPFKNTHWDNKV